MLLEKLRDDSGFTLVELLVVMVLGGVISAIVLNAVVTGARAQLTVERRVTAVTEVQRAVERATRDIRASDARALGFPNRALREIGPDRVVTETYVGSDRIQTVYFTRSVTSPNRTQLCQQRVVQPASNTPPAPPTTPTCQLVLIDSLANTPAQPLFTYYDIDGALVTGSDPSAVRRVELAVLRTVEAAAPIEVRTIVELRNGR